MRERKTKVIKSSKTYWEFVETQDSEGDSKEPPMANPDVLPAPAPPVESEERDLKLRAIREAGLTQQELLILSLLVDRRMTQEEAAQHLNTTRSAVAATLNRAREKIGRKLHVLRLKDKANLDER